MLSKSKRKCGQGGAALNRGAAAARRARPEPPPFPGLTARRVLDASPPPGLSRSGFRPDPLGASGTSPRLCLRRLAQYQPVLSLPVR